MSILAAVILGIVQGLSEFIPISSTAHLTLVGGMFDVIDASNPKQWTAFMATIQLGTLAAAIWYFRTDIVQTTRAFFLENIGARRRSISEQSPEARLGWLIIVATLPIVVIGLLIKDFIEGSFTKELPVIAIGLISVGVLLFVADRYTTRLQHHKNSNNITVLDSLWIGLAQVLALIPGASRSGTTIMAALFRGVSREHAARFSFVMSIPAIFGAGVLEFVSVVNKTLIETQGLELLVATVVSGISGYLAIAFFLRFLRTRSLNVFVAYRIALGSVILLTSCSPSETQQQPEHVQGQTQVQTPQQLDGGKHDADSQTVSDEGEQTAVVLEAEVTDVVRIETSKGRIDIGLYGMDAPLTTKNFLTLVKRRYYDRTRVHRVSKDFVIQLGDPLTRDVDNKREWGQGGETADGKELPEELNANLPSAKIGYKKGVVAMARKPAPGTGTSQFFICLDKAAKQPYQYTIFGKVIRGLDVVEKIASVDVEPGLLGENDGTPVEPIVVRKIRKR